MFLLPLLFFDLLVKYEVKSIAEFELSLGICLEVVLQKLLVALFYVYFLLAFYYENAIEFKIVDGSVEKIPTAFFKFFTTCELLLRLRVQFFISPLMILFSHFLILGFENVRVNRVLLIHQEYMIVLLNIWVYNITDGYSP